jgi:protein-S-isoprenylcysteine O-methyltransferase Ste14
MTNPATHNYLILYWIIFAIILFPVLFFVKQPYGRHFRKGWGPSISNRIGWAIMEIPSLIILSYFFIASRNFTATVTLLFALWFIHYFNRSLVFPFRIKTKGKKMPLVIVLFAIIFNIINASFNGLDLSKTLNFPCFSTTDFIRFGLGFLLLATGMIINLSSDNILIGLRKSSTTGYQIPQKGMFKWVSCPNYLGEIIEWVGFATMAWNLAALSFAIWTIVNLLPRAIDHHKWYRQYFADYPGNRKAIIPFIL